MNQFFEIVTWVGAITALLLATQAIVNPEIKKVLAYSTGSQIGYMMMALGIAGLSTNFVDGYTAGFFHLISHALFKASLFMAAGAILHTVHSRFMNDMGGLKKNMRKTYIFFLLASLSLASAPLITLGFWSKDAIFASILESNYEFSSYVFLIAVTVAIMTAFYTFRMVGLVFFGKPSQNVVNIENKGHRIREVDKMMWLPFAALAIASIGFGVVGFAFEGQLHDIFSTYLASYFGIIEGGVVPLGPTEAVQSSPELAESGAATVEGSKQDALELNPLAVVSSVAAFGVGGFLGYLFYIKRIGDPEKISDNVVSKALWKFLYNRWYLNSVLYWAGVVIPLAAYRRIYKYFENILMYGINPSVQQSMVMMSKVAKVVQTGNVQTYLYVFAAGIIIITMLLLS
jgi:NADH-quinone oxidoreductase subunit L